MAKSKNKLEKARKQVKSAFFVTTVIGLIIALMFSSAEEDQKFSTLILLIPMAGYIIYGNQLATRHKYMSEFADSVYYLGFSFTLISLLFATMFEKLQADPEKTISYFGMALSTTIFGLLYRNYHMQFTDLNTDPLDKAKKQLETEVENFGVMSEALGEGMETIRSNFEKTAEKLTNAIPEKIEYATASIEDKVYLSLSKLDKNLEGIDELYEDSLKKTKSTYEDIGNVTQSNLENLIHKLESMTIDVDAASDQIVSSIKRSAKVTKDLDKGLSEFRDKAISNDKNGFLNDVLTSFKSTSDELIKLNKGVKSLNKSYNNNIKDLEKTSKAINGEIKQIEKIFKDVEGLVKKKFE